MIVKEKQIQQMCLNYLEILENQGKLYFFRSGAGAVKTIRTNGSQGFFKTGKAGVPDITLLYKGKFIGLEIKTEKGKQSLLQEFAQTKIEASGGYYFIVKSLQELIKLIEIL